MYSIKPFCPNVRNLYLHLDTKRQQKNQRDKNNQNFRNEYQRHFLNLRQGLEQTDQQTDNHCNQQQRPDNQQQRENRVFTDFNNHHLCHNNPRLSLK